MINSIAHTMISMVQNSKKHFVDTFVKHEGLKYALNQFVDAQTEYTKKAVDTGLDTVFRVAEIATSYDFVDSLTKTDKKASKAK